MEDAARGQPQARHGRHAGSPRGRSALLRSGRGRLPGQPLQSQLSQLLVAHAMLPRAELTVGEFPQNIEFFSAIQTLHTLYIRPWPLTRTPAVPGAIACSRGARPRVQSHVPVRTACCNACLPVSNLKASLVRRQGRIWLLEPCSRTLTGNTLPASPYRREGLVCERRNPPDGGRTSITGNGGIACPARLTWARANLGTLSLRPFVAVGSRAPPGWSGKPRSPLPACAGRGPASSFRGTKAACFVGG